MHVVKIAGGELDPNDDTANLDENYKALEDVKSEQENETFIGKSMFQFKTSSLDGEDLKVS